MPPSLRKQLTWPRLRNLINDHPGEGVLDQDRDRFLPNRGRCSSAIRGKRVIACALVAVLGLSGATGAAAQPSELPRLGEAAGDELSPAAERRLGEAIMREIRRSREAFDDSELTDYLNRLAARLALHPAASGFQFELFAVEDRSINAFALPGGFIGVHTGLVAASQAESELASVIAHEIGHVTQRHIARMLSQSRQTSTIAMASILAALAAMRSNPQAAMGLASLGSAVQMQQMLGFSRDAEREADRSGVEMLQHAGFDPQGMVEFFGRLQSATRLNESSLPPYLRTHPLSSERMTDIQNRLLGLRYRQHADSPEFALLKARFRALSDSSVDGLRRSRAVLVRQIEDGIVPPFAGHYALAANAAAAGDWGSAKGSIDRAREAQRSSHPYVENLAALIEIESGLPRAALQTLDRASRTFGRSRSLERTRVQALAALKDWEAGAEVSESALESWPDDAQFWEALARSRAAQGQTARAHLAMAEVHIRKGAWLAAIDQLQSAQRTRQLDFYAGSEVDARLRQLRARHLQELEDRRAGRL